MIPAGGVPYESCRAGVSPTTDEEADVEVESCKVVGLIGIPSLRHAASEIR